MLKTFLIAVMGGTVAKVPTVSSKAVGKRVLRKIWKLYMDLLDDN